MKKAWVCASVLALAAATAAVVAPVLAQAPPAPAPVAGQVAAEQRPNVLIWLMDDVGYAQVQSFGGLIDTPNIDRVARMGVRYANYHTAPICSATRAALLTGRNPHSVHMGGHAGASRPFPGYDAKIPAEDGTVAEYLRQAGYQTFALGKWDHLPGAEQNGAGPYVRWPLGQGFDRYFGFLAADTDNWEPLLIQDNRPVPGTLPHGAHLTAALADQAIDMIAGRAARPKTAPFFMYWATGVAHAPHHAPAEWIARYKGRFDMGWDVARQRILKAQIAQGLVSPSTRLAPRPQGMPAWNSLSPDQRRLYARQMEVFAAALSHADAEFGRVLDALQARGELDNTLVIITSDNGASAEGAFSGSYNEGAFANSHLASDAENLTLIDKWGGPETYPHYSFGWAVAGNTPLRFYKQTTHEGGTRVPLVVAWPRGLPGRGEVRSQFAYVTDLTPTIMQLAQVPQPLMANSATQTPFEGRSLAPSLRDGKAADASRSQYVEMYGNKGLWADGWSIVTSHRISTWDMTLATESKEPWELYDLRTDPGQTRDLAAKHPERVAAMAKEFDAQAERYNVNPLGNMSDGGKHQSQQMQAALVARRGIWTYSAPAARVGTILAPPALALSYRMSADVTLATGRETGPIFAVGGAIGGAGFYLRAGRPVFVMRSFTGDKVEVQASKALPPGASKLELEFKRPVVTRVQPVDMQVTIRAGGETLATQTVQQFALPIALPFDSFEIGRDDGSTVTSDYASGAPFPGKLTNVVFDFSDVLKRPQ